jgi:putative acetyltransferase
MSVSVRAYVADDAMPTWVVFQSAVRRTAVRDYSEEQVRAWAPDELDDAEAWAARRASAVTFVAVEGDQVVGFSDLRDEGLLDMLFVHPEWVGRGVARTLVERVVQEADKRGVSRVVTHASRTARPAFEALGFVVDREKTENWIRGQNLPNFDMHYDISS